MSEPVGYTIDVAAKMLGRSPAATRQAIWRGSIPSVLAGGRRLVPAAYLDAVREGRPWPWPAPEIREEP
jgi:hypothetical protein